jgi:hypothetical protein
MREACAAAKLAGAESGSRAFQAWWSSKRIPAKNARQDVFLNDGGVLARQLLPLTLPASDEPATAGFP